MRKNQTIDREQPFNPYQIQTHIIRASYIGGIAKEMLAGGLMIMFASHVLNFSSGQISLIVTLIPFWLVFRYPILHWVNELPRFKVIMFSRLVQIAIVLLLILLPKQAISLWVLLVLSSIFIVSNEFFLNAVWNNMVTEITEMNQRGQFLGRLRTQLQAIGIMFTVGVFFFVGKLMEETEYKILLLVCLAFLVNAVFWLQNMHDTPLRRKIPKQDIKFLRVLISSPLLRRPLALSIIKSIWEWPIILIYMLNTLNMPANVMTLFLIMRTLGGIFSLFYWGKLIDRVGCRKVFIQTFWASLLLYPILLFIPDYALIEPSGIAAITGTVALLVFGILMGVVMAGQNMAMTIYYTAYLKNGQGYYALNILTAVTRLFLSAITAAGGVGLIYLEKAQFSPANAFANNLLWYDPFKLGMIIFTTLILLAGLYLAKNIKPQIN